MARLHFGVGVRFLLHEQVYFIRDVMVDDSFLVENQSFGGRRVYTRSELVTAWGDGNLLFELRGRNVREDADRPILTSYCIDDFQSLSSHLRETAWRRYQILLPLLQRPAHERTRIAIADYVKNLPPPELVPNLPPSGKRKRSRMAEARSWGSIVRWLRAFEESNGDIRTLVPRTSQIGNSGKTRLDADCEQIITQVLAECATNRARRTVKDVYLLIVNRFQIENVDRKALSLPSLPLPHKRTIYNRVKSAGAESITRRVPSRVEAHADATVFPGPQVSRILERVEIDNTPLDLIVVDEEDRMPIGRPILVYALDAYSGMPFGMYAGFEPASYLTAQNCLLHGILPKPDSRNLYETEHDWPVYGVPETLVVDNGPEFTGRDLADGCAQLGIILERMPVKTPWFKGAIERFFRTNNTGLIHGLPGSTLSNILMRGDFDPSKFACISLNAFRKLLHIFLLDIYSQDWHKRRNMEGIPANLWAENIGAGNVPMLDHSAADVRILLSRSDERTLQPTGIDFETLRYQAPALARLRSELGVGVKVRIKYDPTDISRIYVYDPTIPKREGFTRTSPWLLIPAVGRDYTHGLSLYKHRVIRNYVIEKMKKEVNIVNLAEAHQHIQQIVAEEFALTRKHKGRKTAARFLGVGTASDPGVTSSSPKTRAPKRALPAPPPPPSTPLPALPPGELSAPADETSHSETDTPVTPIQNTAPRRGRRTKALANVPDSGSTEMKDQSLPSAEPPTTHGVASEAQPKKVMRRPRTPQPPRQATPEVVPPSTDDLELSGWDGDYQLLSVKPI